MAGFPDEVGSNSSSEGYRQPFDVPLHGHEYVCHRTRKHPSEMCGGSRCWPLLPCHPVPDEAAEKLVGGQHVVVVAPRTQVRGQARRVSSRASGPTLVSISLRVTP